MLAPLIPNADVRFHVMQEIRPRGMDFFSEAIPVGAGWPNAPCGYIHFTESYVQYVELARERGWPVREFKGVGHFHMLVDPAAVADAIEGVAKEMVGE
jgi:pimeloyl-ACP methyl ester carboxylesterase